MNFTLELELRFKNKAITDHLTERERILLRLAAEMYYHRMSIKERENKNAD